MKVIILDGHLKSALAAVRSLGKRGIDVICASDRGSAMGLHSRYCSDTFVYPSPSEDRQGFIDTIVEFANNIGSKPLIYSFSDETFLPISDEREKLEKCITLVLSNEESINIAFDKVETLSLAKRLEVPHTDYYEKKNLKEIKDLAQTLLYPVVIKPRNSCVWVENKGVKGTASYVFKSSELISKSVTIHIETGKWPLIQNFIKGEEYGVEVLCLKGKIVAVSSHKRIRSLNPSGGAAVVKETICDNEKATRMEDYAQRFSQELKWNGVMMLEFKMDEKEEILKLLEINGRFWGSLPLAVYAGVDFPYLFFEQAQGFFVEKEEEVIRSKSVVRSRHFLGDLNNLVSVLFKKDKMRKILYPKRREAIKEFFRLNKNQKYDVVSLNDFKPFLFEIIDVIKRRL